MSFRNRSVRTAIVTVLMGSLVFGSGCKGMSGEQKEGSIWGGIIGTGVGVGLGALIGGKKHRAEGMVIGGLIGMGAGVWAGNEVGKKVAAKKAKYATQEAFLDDQIVDARKKRDAAAVMNDELAKEIAALQERQRTASAQAAQQAQELLAKTELDKLLTGLDNEIKFNEEALKETRIDAKRTTDLQTQIDQLEAERKELQQHRDELMKIANAR